jgi:hypothetical protein
VKTDGVNVRGPSDTKQLEKINQGKKPEAATAVVELLMMGVRTPETC